jgi:hypothetical protein
MVEGSACSCFHPTWKPTSHMMATKVSWTTSWVPMASLSWTQCKRWTLIGLMGCMHAQHMILTIEGWDSPNCVWNAMKIIGENNWKAGKISWIIS